MGEISHSDSVSSLLSRINSIAGDSPDGVERDSKARAELYKASRELTAHLEPPYTTISSMAFNGCRLAIIVLACDIGLFQQVSNAHGPLTVQNLAKICNTEEALMKHITRMLVSQRFLAQAGTTFKATPLTRHMTKPNVQAGVKFHLEIAEPVLCRTPAFFRQNKYRMPQGTSNSPFNWVCETDEDAFTYWSKRPEASEQLNTFIKGYFGEPHVTPREWFPYDKVIFNGFDPMTSGSDYVYVDVGGGKGLNLSRLLEKYTTFADQGKFALEDLPQTIEQVFADALDPRIERVPQDFFQPQAIRGARAYNIENVLHNWPDEDCRKILGRIKDAMIPGYSKLIVSTMVLPEEGVSQMLAQMDIHMLLMHSSGARSEQEWKDLIGSVSGLRIVKVWLAPMVLETGNGVMEVERVDE